MLEQTAQEILSKTILAADESTNTIKKRFEKIGIQSTPEINREYRQLLFTTPGIEEYVSGVIMYDETIRQTDDAGKPFPRLLAEKKIVPGIKVDKGTAPLEGSTVDTVTKGIEGLSMRLTEYVGLGARFAKWRAVYTISQNAPSEAAIRQNALDLAQYAELCQESDIVPIVEPEVLMDGSHSIEQDKEITIRVLTEVFKELKNHNINLRGMILKPNMVTAGSNSTDQKSVEEVAQTTLDVLKQTVPPEVPGIAFLSGGQSPDLATDHLRAINKIRNANPQQYPWRITASYGRALQGEMIETWGGKSENARKAQQIFIERAKKVYEAFKGM